MLDNTVMICVQNGVITTLLEHIQRSIEEDTKVCEMEVEYALLSYTLQAACHNETFNDCMQVDGIVSELQANWSEFERMHSEIYLQQIKVDFST